MRKPHTVASSAAKPPETKKPVAAADAGAAADGGGECDCCANDSKPCDCATKDQTADGVCACDANCSGCTSRDCDGDIEAAASTDEEEPAAAAPPARAKAASPAAPGAGDELARLRAENAALRRGAVAATASSTVDAAVRAFKMPPLPAVAKDGETRPETLSSLFLETLVDTKMNADCTTCQASHDRVTKAIALLPPMVQAGRLAMKPVKETASVVTGPSATIEQGELHAEIAGRLAAEGLQPGTKKYARAYKKYHTELSVAAAAAAG